MRHGEVCGKLFAVALLASTTLLWMATGCGKQAAPRGSRPTAAVRLPYQEVNASAFSIDCRYLLGEGATGEVTRFTVGGKSIELEGPELHAQRAPNVRDTDRVKSYYFYIATKKYGKVRLSPISVAANAAAIPDIEFGARRIGLTRSQQVRFWRLLGRPLSAMPVAKPAPRGHARG